jgi:hypothetical protein
VRIACLLLVGALLGGLALRGAPDAAGAAWDAARVAPGALIELGALFGTEHAEDEDEPDEREGESAVTAARPVADERPRTSLRVVLLSLVLGAMGGAVAANRLRSARERLGARWRAR